MNFLKKSLVLILFFQCCFAQTKTDDSLREAKIEKAIISFENKLNESIKSNRIPGIAVAIVSKEKVHYLKTFGVKRLGVKDEITPYTLFQVASLSKPINATILGMLQEQGKLSLQDPVNKHLPVFFYNKKKKPLRICHLVSHSSGIPSTGFDHLIEINTPKKDIFYRLQNTAAVAPPGKVFLYHNAMYGMIEDIVVKAYGKSLSKVLKEELFIPLGMHKACVGLTCLLSNQNKAFPHVTDKKGHYRPANDYSKAYYAVPSAGGVNASISDLIPFLQLYLGKPSSIISSKSLKELTSPFVKNDNSFILNDAKKGLISDTFYGFGWHSMRFAKRKIIYHQGHLKGFRNFMGYLPDDVGIIILTNAEKKHASKLAIKFFELYLNTI